MLPAFYSSRGAWANTLYEVVKAREGSTTEGIVSDQVVRFTGKKALRCGLPELRLTSDCPQTAKRYEFMTISTTWRPAPIAAIYKGRRQIELFFKS